jgi:hypothetical protein
MPEPSVTNFHDGDPEHHAIFHQMHAEALLHGFVQDGPMHEHCRSAQIMRHATGCILVLHRGFANFTFRPIKGVDPRNSPDHRSKHEHGNSVEELTAALEKWEHAK